MPACLDPEMKYIRPYEAGFIVEINRAEQSYVKKFTFRQNGGYEETLKTAKADRDSQHLAMFGYPVSRRFFHVKKRKRGDDSSELPPGISHGYSRGGLLYVVASYCDKEGKPSRKRFNIKKLGYDKAKKEAESFLAQKRIEIITHLDSVVEEDDESENDLDEL
ncbi:hypothetical protein [Vibrio owensii]|uniref:hypothetical protein n=1 Tax=Vibrio owensii TaxID=696485 RepID=UPI003CC5117F